MSLNLDKCRGECTTCIKAYVKKHTLKKGETFAIECTGIPKEYIPHNMLSASDNDPETMIALYDPVTWAKKYLDWHCLDPDGSIWKRKWEEGSLIDLPPYDEEKALNGKSIFHRPYQALILGCSAQNKALRLGRQLGKTEMLCISILFNVFNKENFKVVVIAPYQSQIDLIFKRILNLVKLNTALYNSISRNVKAPNYNIELKNGSSILGFTAGTRSGGNADSARGQSAPMLVFDEADYLASGDIDSCLNIVTNFPNPTIWMSSTPTGKREAFFATCNSKLFREYHFPSHINPNWTSEKDAMFRDRLTEDGYKHEICFAKNTLIATPDGEKNIQDIQKDDYVLNHLGEPVKVLQGAWITGQKNIWKFTTSAGEIYCTADHSFPNQQFKKQSIISLQTLPVYFNRKVSYSSLQEEIYARLVAYNLGDGSSCSTRYQSSFYSDTESDMEMLREDVKTIFPKYDAKVVFDIVKNTRPNALVKTPGERYTVNVSKNITLDLLQHEIVRGRRTYQEFDVPCFVKNGSLEIKREFLAALFGAEGSTPRPQQKKSGYSAATISLSMCKQKGINGHKFFQSLISLCSDLDIEATYTNKQDLVGYQTYILYIYNDINNILRFFEKIGYRYAAEKEKLAWQWVHYLKYWQNQLKEKQAKFELARILRKQTYSYQSILKHTNLTISQIDKAIHLGTIPSRLYNKEIKTFEEWLLERNIDTALFIDIFSSNIKKSDIEDVYNITVDTPDHSYLLANGIRTYNCAIFGEQEQGVYQHKYIEMAKASYKYEDMKPTAGWLYSIGVDWNDQKIGVTIAVVGYNHKDHKFYLVDKKVVSKSEYTQLIACQIVTEYNRLWNPFAIYIDRGFGQTQWEILRKFGHDAMRTQGAKHADARFVDILKAVEFGGTIETYDLFTKEIIKKPTKPFLVENSVRRFEQNMFFFPESDEQYIKSLQGYIVKRISYAGAPVYEEQSTAGDHFLDAVNLALLAFTLEQTEMGSPRFVVDIAFAPRLQMRGEGLVAEKDHNPIQAPGNRVGFLDGANQSVSQERRDVPVMNTTTIASNWIWDGFLRDEPRPTGSRTSMLRRGKPHPPRRKNI